MKRPLVSIESAFQKKKKKDISLIRDILIFLVCSKSFLINARAAFHNIDSRFEAHNKNKNGKMEKYLIYPT